MLHAVIMSGGAGTRFWPASRQARPKQLLQFSDDQSLLQATAARLDGLAPPERTWVFTNSRLVAATSEQLPQLPAASILGEPCKRDTAPCIGLAAELLIRQDPDAVLAVFPADHVIQPAEAFRQAIRDAEELVRQKPERIVVFGIKPTYPAETFGYIERREVLPENSAAFAVERFHEKPTAETAAGYLRQGGFYWNAGIFVWRAETIRDALREYQPQMAQHLETIAEAFGSPRFDEVFAREFAAIEGRSIDYAVMEQYPETVVMEAAFQWDDVGAWGALPRLHGQDENGNTILGKHLGFDTKGSVVCGDAEHLIVTVGLEDCLVVHTPDATLVARKEEEETLRRIVPLLKEKDWTEFL